MVKLGIIIGTEGKQRFRGKMGAKNFHLLLNLPLGVKGWSLQTGEQNTEDLSYVEEMDDSQGRSGSMKLFHAGGTTVESWFKTLASWLLKGPDNFNQKCPLLISESNSVCLCTPNLLNFQIIQTSSLFSRRFKRCGLHSTVCMLQGLNLFFHLPHLQLFVLQFHPLP